MFVFYVFSAEISRLINYILLTSFYCRKVMAKDRERRKIFQIEIILHSSYLAVKKVWSIRKARYSSTIDLFKADLISFCKSNIWTEDLAPREQIASNSPPQ